MNDIKTIFSNVESWGFAHWTYIVVGLVCFIAGRIL